MKALIHVGVGDARETYEYTPGKLLNVEFIAMERVTGIIGLELDRALDKGSVNALTALIWVLRKRQEPTLRFEQVVFNTEDLDMELFDDDGTPLVFDEPEVEPNSNGAQPAAPKAPAGRATGGGKKKSARKRSHSAATTNSTSTGQSSPES